MLVKIGRLISLYNILLLLLLFIKNEKKTLYKYCISYFKIKCTRNKTKLTFQIDNFNY